MSFAEQARLAESMIYERLFDLPPESQERQSLMLVFADVLDHIVDAIKEKQEQDGGIESHDFIKSVAVGLQKYVNTIEKTIES